MPSGCRIRVSPIVNEPPLSVPVTTVPVPLGEKIRSIGKRGFPISRLAGAFLTFSKRIFFSSSIPSPVCDDTGMMGADEILVS